MPKGYSILPRKSKTIDPQAPYRRVFGNNHYKEKGLDFQLFLALIQQDCHYCGTSPALTNPYGSTYESHQTSFKTKAGRESWWQAQWIAMNGIDKMLPCDNYKDASNLVPCCRTCNFMKSNLSYSDFKNHIAKIYSHD